MLSISITEKAVLKTVKARVSQNKCIWCSCFHLTVMQLCTCLRKWNCRSEISHHCSLYLHCFGHAH